MNHMYGDLSNLNAPYDSIPVSGIGQFAEPDDYPWRVESLETRLLQQHLNASLRGEKGCLLLEDGVLGPRTCGALKHYGRMGEIQSCVNHAGEETPILPTIPCPTSSPSPPRGEEEELVRAGSTGVPGWAIGLGLGALAIAAVMLMKGKKKKKR